MNRLSRNREVLMVHELVNFALHLFCQDPDTLRLTLTRQVRAKVAVVVRIPRHMKLKTDGLSTLIRRLLEAKVVLPFCGCEMFEMIR